MLENKHKLVDIFKNVQSQHCTVAGEDICILCEKKKFVYYNCEIYSKLSIDNSIRFFERICADCIDLVVGLGFRRNEKD